MAVASVDRCVRNGVDELERHLVGTRLSAPVSRWSVGRWNARGLLDEGSCVRAGALHRSGLVQLNQGLGLGVETDRRPLPLDRNAIIFPTALAIGRRAFPACLLAKRRLQLLANPACCGPQMRIGARHALVYSPDGLQRTAIHTVTTSPATINRMHAI